MILALLYADEERSFDSFHTNHSDIYRINTVQQTKEGVYEVMSGTGQVQGPAFTRAIPEIRMFTRVLGGNIYNDMAANDKAFRIKPLFVDPDFLKIFDFKILQGSLQTALKETAGIVLTETTARKYFNRIDVVGQQLALDADPSFDRLGKPLVVSAVVADPPANSSFQFDALFSFPFLQLSFTDDAWLNAYLGTYVLLRPDADPNKVEKKFDGVFAFHAKEQIAQSKKIFGYAVSSHFKLDPLTDIHLNRSGVTTQSGESGIVNTSSSLYPIAFTAIAGFILLMASINFINISIANSLKRAKEVGIRKISGGSRIQIILQFLAESSFLCLISLLLAVVLVQFTLPVFNELTEKQLSLWNVIDANFFIKLFLLFISIILVSGIYPSVILSNFKPAKVLYNRQKLSGKNIFGRALVVLQFSLAIFFLIVTLIYHSQMDFIRTKDLGYNPQNIIRTAISGNRDYASTISMLKAEFAKEPTITLASFGSDGGKENIEVNNKSIRVQYPSIDENHLEVLGIKLVSGRNLSRSFPTDTKYSVLVNETFARQSGLTNVIGSSVRVQLWNDSSVKIIRGIVKDFHFGSLREPIAPMVMHMPQISDGGIWVKFDKAQQQQALAAMERIYKKTMPGSVYRYDFLDELNANDYRMEQRWQKLITIGSVISLIICCLGLFGLAHLSTNRRVKEIGIRKVLGASIQEITLLISGSFLKLVVLAFLIAAPLGWLMMSSWLERFAYRISIGPAIFIIAASISILIAFSVVSIHAIKSALANPVKSLRTE